MIWGTPSPPGWEKKLKLKNSLSGKCSRENSECDPKMLSPRISENQEYLLTLNDSERLRGWLKDPLNDTRRPLSDMETMFLSCVRRSKNREGIIHLRSLEQGVEGILSKYIHISNHHIANFKCLTIFVNYTSMKLKKITWWASYLVEWIPVTYLGDRKFLFIPAETPPV